MFSSVWHALSVPDIWKVSGAFHGRSRVLQGAPLYEFCIWRALRFDVTDFRYVSTSKHGGEHAFPRHVLYVLVLLLSFYAHCSADTDPELTQEEKVHNRIIIVLIVAYHGTKGTTPPHTPPILPNQIYSAHDHCLPVVFLPTPCVLPPLRPTRLPGQRTGSQVLRGGHAAESGRSRFTLHRQVC